MQLKRLWGGAVLMASLSATSPAFINPGFETGNLAGWNVGFTPEGQTLWQQATVFDVTGTGASWAGHFSVGRTGSTGTHGVELTQMLNLSGGVTYTFGYDLAVHNTHATSSNVQGGIFDLIVNGSSLTQFNTGSIAAGSIRRSTLSADFTAPVTGSYVVGARIARPFIPPAAGTLHQYVDNFEAVPEPGTIAALSLGALALVRRRKKKTV